MPCPISVQEGNKGGVLQLDLRDHKHRRVVLLVQQADEPQLFDQLQAEANRRFDRCAGMRGWGLVS